VGAVIIGMLRAVHHLMSTTISRIGARLGISEHPDENKKAFGFNLTVQDSIDIEAVLMHSNGREMITTVGDCGAEYR
jgi:hypothetical protein